MGKGESSAPGSKLGGDEGRGGTVEGLCAKGLRVARGLIETKKEKPKHQPNAKTNVLKMGEKTKRR